MAEILIIEDEVKLRQELEVYLNNNGYLTKVIESFENTLEQMNQFDGDLILLDINLPNVNGQFLCKEYRKNSSNYGADDFVTKPYNPLILLARIEAVLKRTQPTSDVLISYEKIKLDVSKSSIIDKNKVIELSKNELKIFYFLLLHRGKIKSREELMDYLWDSDMFVDDNTLTVNINRLRKKLEDIGLNDVIHTRRGQGYIIL